MKKSILKSTCSLNEIHTQVKTKNTKTHLTHFRNEINRDKKGEMDQLVRQWAELIRVSTGMIVHSYVEDVWNKSSQFHKSAEE